MPSPDPHDPRTYGLHRVVWALAASSLWTLSTLGLVVAAGLESVVQGRFSGPSESFAMASFGLACSMFPVAIFLAYSPRTRPSHISMDRAGPAPALVLRQSRSIFTTELVLYLGLAAFFASMIASIHEPGAPLAGSLVALVVTCGWQAGYLALVLLRRLRPGRVAICAGGIAFTNRASDTWIPWEAVLGDNSRRNPTHAEIFVDPGSGVTVTSRVPRPWRRFDSRPPFDVQPSSEMQSGRVVSIDRRYFRIAPELIDAALRHYITNTEARQELTDPDAVARVVARLRGHAPGPWWRSYRTPVCVPELHSQVPTPAPTSSPGCTAAPRAPDGAAPHPSPASSPTVSDDYPV